MMIEREGVAMVAAAASTNMVMGRQWKFAGMLVLLEALVNEVAMRQISIWIGTLKRKGVVMVAVATMSSKIGM